MSNDEGDIPLGCRTSHDSSFTQVLRDTGRWGQKVTGETVCSDLTRSAKGAVRVYFLYIVREQYVRQFVSQGGPLALGTSAGSDTHNCLIPYRVSHYYAIHALRHVHNCNVYAGVGFDQLLEIIDW